jgi:chromosome segregation protein
VAAARLRDLYRARDQRRSGWDEGAARRDRARARLESLDRSLVDLAAKRVAAGEALARAERLLAEAGERKGAAEAALRDTVDRESRARSVVAAGAARGARLAQLGEEIARLEASHAQAEGSLEHEEGRFAAAEREFRMAEQAHRRAEVERRRVLEELAGKRAAHDAHRRSLAAAEADRLRVAANLDANRGRIRALAAERDRLESEIERLDAAETPLALRRDRLEVDRRRLAAEVSRLQDALREHEARRQILAARKRDLEETAGSRFLASHGRAALGLLRDLVRAPAGLELALGAALGPMADAVVYEDSEVALAEAGRGDGATLALADPSPPARDGIDHERSGDRALVAEVNVDPRILPLARLLLRDVYVAHDLDEAARRHRRLPHASFVTEEGVLVGPSVIRTTGATTARADGIRRELLVLERDVAATRNALRPVAGELERVATEAARISVGLERSDGLITAAADRMGRADTELSSLRKEEEMLAGRLVALEGAVSAAREAMADTEPVAALPPDMPPAPGHPTEQAVEVETLRRERSRLEAALARARRERRVLAGKDPDVAERDLSIAEDARRRAETGLREAEEEVAALALARATAAAADRESTAAESEANREWRDAAGNLEGLREEYEQEDRAREDLERRIRDAEGLLSEGHGRDPKDAVSAVGPDETVQALERRSGLVARRLSLLGRVNLLAGGEFEALQERHDFLARELEDVKKARRDLLELIRRIDEHVVALFDRAFRDVAAEFERLFLDLFPDGEGRLVLTDPANVLGSGIEVEARPGRKRVKRISLLSGGERALSALAFLFAIFRARPSPFYLLDEVEAALDDVNLSRFLRLIRGFAQTAQVIVVTHQKRTMEAADILYGVSMGRDGSSAVISQRMSPETSGEPDSRPASVGLPEPAPGGVR